MLKIACISKPHASKPSCNEIKPVPQLVVASHNASLGYASPSVVHDLRNLLATVGLHLETLQRLCGPSGTKAADAAQALLTRGAALCNKALDCTAKRGQPRAPSWRGPDAGRASRRRPPPCERTEEFFPGYLP